MVKLTVNEEICLIAVWHLKDEAYGVNIRQKVKELTGNWIILGTLYNMLEQMMRKGYVTSRKGEPTSQRGGHNKVFYSLTRDGEAALEKARELHEKLWNSLPQNAFGG
ncbi:PadR family transcriptional regulator [candidate division KSB1 bacterium]